MVNLKKLTSVNKKQEGFTILELLIAFAIAFLVVGAVTTAIFQVFNNSARSSNHMTAVRHAQKAGAAVSRDAKMAQDVTSSAAPGFPLTLDWDDWAGVNHQVIYDLSGNDLTRSYSQDGGSATTIIVAQHIDAGGTSILWNAAEKVLTLTVTASVGTGSQQGNETRIYEVIPRPSL